MTERLPGSAGRDMRNCLYLTLISAVLFILPLLFFDLPGGDETRVAGIAAEMAVEGDILTPKLNGVPFLEYPPLCYAAISSSFHLFGFTPFAAKLPSALAALTGVLVLYAMMRMLRYPGWLAFAGAFMMATDVQYLFHSGDCRADMFLTFFCTLSWLGCFVLLEEDSASAGRRQIAMAALAIGIAGGLLTKNLSGLAIPLSGTVCTIFLRSLIERRFFLKTCLYLAGAVLIGLLPYAVYLWLLHRDAGPDALKAMLIDNNFGRFLGKWRDSHSEPFWFYLCRFPEIFLPYQFFMLGGIVLGIRKFYRRRIFRGLIPVFMLIIPFLLLSVSSGKRMIYLLPLSAPAVLLAALALPFVRRLCLRLRPAAFCLVRRHACLFLGTLVVLSTLITTIHTGKRSHKDSFAPAFEEAEKLCGEGGRLMLFRPDERLSGAAYFYRHKITPSISGWENMRPGDMVLIRHLSKNDPSLPITFTCRQYPDSELYLVQCGTP